MDAGFFPRLDAATLLPVRSALAQMRRHPRWLEQAGCPYDEATRLALTELLRTSAPVPSAAPVVVPVNDDPDRDTRAELERDTRQMLADLKAFAATDANKEPDAKERIAIFRVATQLMSKLVELQERALNLKQISEFQRAVLSVFDQVLDPGQRTAALRLLEEYGGMQS